MSFHVHIPNAPPHQQQQHHRRRPGPSRLRRAVVLEKQKHEKEQLKKLLKVTTSSQPHPIAKYAVQATITENAVKKIAANANDGMHPHPQPLVSDAAVQADLRVHVHHQEAEHDEDALCPDQFFLPAVEAVQARPSNNLVQLDGAVDQEDDDQDHAHARDH